jgi:peroxiredoxin
MITKHWTVFTLLILTLCAGWIWVSASSGEASGEIATAPSMGLLAPEFSLSTPQGEVIALSGLRGRAVLVNFWASWCPPCRAEMPAMQKVYEEYRDEGFLILAINATHQDNPEQALAFADNLSLSFPILFDADGIVMERYKVTALPTSFFILPDGTIQELVVGGPMSEALLYVRVEKLLERKP